MGLTIHYQGRFNPEASLEQMIEEVKDIAKVNDWDYFVFDTVFPENSFGTEHYDENIYGISFTPHEKCETVFLTFLSNGRMSSIMNLRCFGDSNDPEEAAYLYMLFTKTQYAGPDIHKIIIHLLRYLSKKYLLDFTVDDEGYYWETGDEKLLNETFHKYAALIDSFANTLATFPKIPEESFEQYFERLLAHIDKKRREESGK